MHGHKLCCTSVGLENANDPSLVFSLEKTLQEVIKGVDFDSDVYSNPGPFRNPRPKSIFLTTLRKHPINVKFNILGFSMMGISNLTRVSTLDAIGTYNIAQFKNV